MIGTHDDTHLDIAARDIRLRCCVSGIRLTFVFTRQRRVVTLGHGLVGDRQCMHFSSCGLDKDALNGAAKGDGEANDADATWGRGAGKFAIGSLAKESRIKNNIRHAFFVLSLIFLKRPHPHPRVGVVEVVKISREIFHEPALLLQ